MRKLLVLLLAVSSGWISAIHAQDGWEQMTPMKVATGASISCVMDSLIYIIGGQDAVPMSLNTTVVYNTKTDTWSDLAPAPDHLTGQSAGVINDKIYLKTEWKKGSSRWVPTDSTFAYNPAEDSWESLERCPKKGGGHASCALNNKFYLLGGEKDVLVTHDISGQNEALVYDPETDTWDSIPDMLYERCSPNAIVNDNQIYVFGGSVHYLNADQLAQRVIGKAEKYDPTENSWTELADLPVPVAVSITVEYNGKMYVFGGVSSHTLSFAPCTNVIQEYNPSTNEWRLMHPMPFDRAAMMGQRVDKFVYLIGGYQGNARAFDLVLDEVRRFNLDSLKPFTYVTNVSLDKDSMELKVGETVQLVAKVLPQNASDPTVSWNSADPAIASVDSDGKVEGKGGGVTKIYVTTSDGQFKDSCRVTVTPYLNGVEKLDYVSASQVKSVLINGLYNSSMVLNGVHVYKIRYNTIDVFGNPTVASGALYVPEHCHETLPLVSYQHYTVLERDEVPSNRYNDRDALVYSGNGYITVLPDFLGMGDNPGIQPYGHWEAEATASIDLIRASRAFLNDSLGIRDNSQIFITGYSLGGHATMAMQKYIQIHDHQAEFNVSASAPASGIYSLSYDAIDLIFNEDATYEGTYFLPMVFASYQHIYGNLYADYSQYYDPPYDSIIASWVASGNYGILPENLYSFMQDSVVDNIRDNPNHAFRVACRKNDVHNWSPQAPVRLLFCGRDITVGPQSAITAQDTMIALGAPDVQAIEINSTGTHSSCWKPSHLYALEWFDSLLPEEYSDIIEERNQEFDAHVSWSNGTVVDTIEVSEYYRDKPLIFSLDNEAFQIDPQTGIISIKDAEQLQTNLSIKFTVKVHREACDAIEEVVAVTINVLDVSTERLRIDDLIEIFPNPTTNIIMIKIHHSGQYSVELTSVNGQHIISKDMEGTSNTLDLSSLKKGIFFLTIRSKDFVTTKKIIK